MRVNLIKGVLLTLTLGIPHAALAETGIEDIRAELTALRNDYEQRIADLEQRLAVAEQNARQTSASSQNPVAMPRSVGSEFNPAIGVIFSGSAWNYSGNPENLSVQGFPFGGEAGPIAEGLALGETELILSSNVDDKFTAMLTAALAVEDGEAVVEIEEAWVEATALPAGFGAKFGRFFSSIGYLNNKHAHSWDFADQPLPYQAFLANQLRDDGIQVRWLAPTDTFIEIGAELLRGGAYPSAGADNSGFGSYSLFANMGADVGTDSSWLAGVSLLDASSVDRASGDEDDPFLFSGDSTLLTAQFVWKWAKDGNWKDRNLILQAEYMHRDETGTYQGAGLSPQVYDNDQAGWYAQAVFQPASRWRIGARFDALLSKDPGRLFDGTALAAPDSDPRRMTIMGDWANSEFSRLRLQFTRDESGFEDDNQLGLQYFHSIGAHGAHTF